MAMKNYGLLLMLAAVATPAAAIEFMGSDWQGEGELGYVATQGNTDTKNLQAKLGIKNERIRWRHTIGLEAINSSDSGTTTAERYDAIWQTDYKITKYDYWLGRIHYETNKFSGYDYRISEVLGYGRRVVDSPSMSLDLEIAPGARQSKFITGDSKNEFILRLTGKYAWKINEQASFHQDLSFDIGEDATVSKSVTALQAKVAGNLAMKLSYTAEHTSTVPLGVEKTDTQTAASLVYGF